MANKMKNQNKRPTVIQQCDIQNRPEHLLGRKPENQNEKIWTVIGEAGRHLINVWKINLNNKLHIYPFLGLQLAFFLLTVLHNDADM
jgi:hypothetical protein